MERENLFLSCLGHQVSPIAKSLNRFPVRRDSAEAATPLNHFEQQKDQHNGENQRQPAAAVVAEPGTHAVPAETKKKDENDQENEHVGEVSKKKK
jgi:hypothetical protein